MSVATVDTLCYDDAGTTSDDAGSAVSDDASNTDTQARGASGGACRCLHDASPIGAKRGGSSKRRSKAKDRRSRAVLARFSADTASTGRFARWWTAGGGAGPASPPDEREYRDERIEMDRPTPDGLDVLVAEANTRIHGMNVARAIGPCLIAPEPPNCALLFPSRGNPDRVSGRRAQTVMAWPTGAWDSLDGSRRGDVEQQLLPSRYQSLP